MVKASDVIYLMDMAGNPLRPLSKEVEWELEEVTGSTNRLIVEIPLKDGFGVNTEQELLFRGKRYIITELTRYRGSGTLTAITDEAQIELSDRNIKTFTLKEAKLPDALRKAVAGSKWTIGEVFDSGTNYFAQIENKSSMYCLSFLEGQSGGKLVFDSIKRVVSLVSLEDKEAEKVFRYKKNMDDISKSEVQPQVTVLYPYGKDGLSIASINGDEEYIEDFSWYTALGVPLADAKKKYTKELVWEDSRYIYAGNLMRDAEKRLATMSHPQINYSIKASGVDAEELSLNEPVYVVDEELGIKLKTVVSRLKLSKDSSTNEIELEYLPSSLGAIFDDTALGDFSGGKSESALFQVKNASSVTVGSSPSIAVTSTVSVFTATHFEVGLSMMFECTQAGLLEGYFMMDGNRMSTEIKQTVTEGWHTIGLPFIITQIQEGTKYLDLYLSTTGAIKIPSEKIEMYIKSQGAYGGTSNKRPDQKVEDNFAVITKMLPAMNDSVKVQLINDITVTTSEAFKLRDAIKVGVSDSVSSELTDI